MKVAILDDYQGVALQLADWTGVDRRSEITVFRENLGGIDAAAEALADFDILCAMRERQPFPRELLERLPRLKCIVTTGRKNAAIDVAAAAERGVTVCGTAIGPGQRATAELTFGLILAASRLIPQQERGLRAGGWQEGLGFVLEGRTLGILGLGATGSMVAAYGRAFGMDVVAWSQNLTAEKAMQGGARLVSKQDLFRLSDVVTIHVILSERTRGVVGADEIALMRRGAVLVNTSRGPVLDEDALVAALEEDRIVAALDVYDREPLPTNHRLRRFERNLILSPHVGYVAREVYDLFYRETVEAVEAFLDGNPVRVINP